VVQSLIGDGYDTFTTQTASDHADRRRRHAGKKAKGPDLTLADARANAFVCDWSAYTPPVPRTLGRETFLDYSLEELAQYIDWMPFFNAWEFHGRFPDILEDETVGDAVRSLYADAQRLLAQIIEEKWLRAAGVIGFFPANSAGDDIQIYTGEDRAEVAFRSHHLRQQRRKRTDLNNDCLADFIAPAGKANDYIGGFAVTAGIGIEEHVARFEAEHDDYSAIILKALADRLAEAFAERMHQRVRTEFWNYASDEQLDNRELITEAYRGIRPAPGYPACPDHTEKGLLWELLDVRNSTGIELTESFAMHPTAAVSGWYFSHPDAHYFAVGKIGSDQVEEYAARKGWTLATAERWLSPNLGYEAAAA